MFKNFVCGFFLNNISDLENEDGSYVEFLFPRAVIALAGPGLVLLLDVLGVAILLRLDLPLTQARLLQAVRGAVSVGVIHSVIDSLLNNQFLFNNRLDNQ